MSYATEYLAALKERAALEERTREICRMKPTGDYTLEEVAHLRAHVENRFWTR